MQVLFPLPGNMLKIVSVTADKNVSRVKKIVVLSLHYNTPNKINILAFLESN